MSGCPANSIRSVGGRILGGRTSEREINLSLPTSLGRELREMSRDPPSRLGEERGGFSPPSIAKVADETHSTSSTDLLGCNSSSRHICSFLRFSAESRAAKAHRCKRDIRPKGCVHMTHKQRPCVHVVVYTCLFGTTENA